MQGSLEEDLAALRKLRDDDASGALKEYLGGDEDPSEWKGVTVAADGRVTALSLGNQGAIAAALAHVAAQRNLEFALFDGRVTTLPETVDLFGSAALVVGVHGAGLANALFCVEGAALLDRRRRGRGGRVRGRQGVF